MDLDLQFRRDGTGAVIARLQGVSRPRGSVAICSTSSQSTPVIALKSTYGFKGSCRDLASENQR